MTTMAFEFICLHSESHAVLSVAGKLKMSILPTENSILCSVAGRTPVSAVARFTLSPLCEHHDGLTGPFPGLKLSDGTDAS